MFHCKFSTCEHVFENVIQFIQHIKLHSNAPNYRYQCGVPDCTLMYRKATVLKTHMYRDHKEPSSCLRRSNPFKTPLKCVAQSCTFKCDTLTSVDWKPNAHSEVATADLQFDPVLPHMFPGNTSRCVEDLDDSVLDKSVPTEPLSQPEPSHNISDEQHEQEVPFAVDETLFLQNLTLLYLKLQAKLLLPASTIQTIVEDFQNAHEISLSHSLNILSQKLKVIPGPL
ncbi:hypothetical protein F7725_009727 [Dissostichus mawsoni]|uniref:C2H2-type domain-containing protein n=1 Tax=Dissostichus mawsoni TaxID=36200 RepID=A0A7J5XN27_DISMA|nr:hypothetical protein F7725_009727 [Dissostichus mawsoni]